MSAVSPATRAPAASSCNVHQAIQMVPTRAMRRSLDHVGWAGRDFPSRLRLHRARGTTHCPHGPRRCEQIVSPLGELDAGEMQLWHRSIFSVEPVRSSPTRSCSFLHIPNLPLLALFKQPLVSPSQPQAPPLWVPPASSPPGGLYLGSDFVPCRIPVLLVAPVRESGPQRGAVRKCRARESSLPCLIMRVILRRARMLWTEQESCALCPVGDLQD